MLGRSRIIVGLTTESVKSINPSTRVRGETESLDESENAVEEKHEEENHEVERGVVSERLVHRSEPEEERAGREECELNTSQEELSDWSVSKDHVEQRGDDVDNKRKNVDEEHVVGESDCFLELHRDLDFNVLVEAWLDWDDCWKWRPVVGSCRVVGRICVH